MAEGKHDRDELAAEFALGTLDGAELARAQTLYDSDPEFARATDGWRETLIPLTEETAPIEPSPNLLPAILKRIASAGRGSGSATVLQLRKQLRLWRIAATTAAAIAAALLVYVALPRTAPKAQNFVAVLQANGKSPAFLASVDVQRGIIGIRRIGAPVAEGHSYELWALGAGRSAPQSLGIVDAVARIPTEKLRKLNSSALQATTFAISLEPKGGSPTGEPTGPVLFVGKLVPTD